MKSRYKPKMFYTPQDIDKYIREEWESQVDKVYADAKRDVAAQLMAVCLTELNKEFGFGKDRLNKFYSGVNDYFRLMSTGGVMGKEFSTLNCINYMIEQYGIDVDKRSITKGK